jgi:predicted MFS family arabinose efflux permease
VRPQPPTRITAFSAWSPLRHEPFRSLWIAQFVSNVGGFMQVVGAVWLMGSLGGTPAMVALVQTAMSIPVFFFSLPAGALADLIDRRWLILWMQVAMLVLALLLALLASAELVTPALLLLLTFALASGRALNTPAWTSVQQDIVPRSEFPQAVTLGAASQNLARVIGPAIGGFILALTAPQTVFVANAITFLGVVLVIWRWRPTPETHPRSTERLAAALRAGVRYAWYASSVRAVLVRTVALTIPASATVALLPVVARDELGLDATGYGTLLSCYGVGAVLASFVLPALRMRFGPDRTIAVGIAAIAFNLVALVLVRSPVVLGATLIVGGSGWLMSLSSLNVAAQISLPRWVRSRGIGLFFLAFQGGIGVGSAAFGAIADAAGLPAAYTTATVALVAGFFATRGFSLARIDKLELEPAAGLAEIRPLAALPEGAAVVITTEYRVPADRRDDFRTMIARVSRMRRRIGAREWRLVPDPADPECQIETYRARSWNEHLDTRARMTVSDQRIEEAVEVFVIPDRRRAEQVG